MNDVLAVYRVFPILFEVLLTECLFLKEKDMKLITHLAAASKSTKAKLFAHLGAREPWSNEEHMKVALAAMGYLHRVEAQREYKVELGQ
eukprot:3687334-Amphidinium_carterae.2